MILTPDDMARCHAIRAPRESLAAIVAAVAAETGITEAEIMGTRRWANVSAARQLVFYIAHREGMSLPVIGQLFDRDHTTVWHGIKAEKARRGE